MPSACASAVDVDEVLVLSVFTVVNVFVRVCPHRSNGFSNAEITTAASRISGTAGVAITGLTARTPALASATPATRNLVPREADGERRDA